MKEEIVVPKNVPEELKEMVRKRIKASNVKYSAQKAKQQQAKEKRERFKQIVHEGSQFFDDNKENIIQGRVTLNNTIDISFAVMKIDNLTDPKDFFMCKSAYAIKSPTDTWKNHIAVGLCNHRLKYPNQWTFPMQVPKIAWLGDPTMVKEATSNIIKSKILLFAPEVPQRVINLLFNGLEKKAKNKDKVTKLMDQAIKCLDEKDFKNSAKYVNEALTLRGATKNEIKAASELIILAEEIKNGRPFTPTDLLNAKKLAKIFTKAEQ